jgi:hypothetical protein
MPHTMIFWTLGEPNLSMRVIWSDFSNLLVQHLSSLSRSIM